MGHDGAKGGKGKLSEKRVEISKALRGACVGKRPSRHRVKQKR